MEKKNTKVSFKNKVIYAGMDVHLKNWVVTIRTGGLAIKTMSMDPDPETLVKYLHHHFPDGTYKSNYEAGFSGFWAHRKLVRLGVENIVINPADVPTTGSEKTQINDKIDSRKLARGLETGDLHGIYIPTEEQEAIRSLCRLRQNYTWDMTAQKNRIKSQAHRLGLQLPKQSETAHWSRRFIDYLMGLTYPTTIDKMVMEELITVLNQKRQTIAGIVKQLRALVKNDEELKKTISLLMSVPGVGFITAMTFKTELIDMKRFKHLDQLSNYVGLVPATHSSGQKERTLGLKDQHQPYLRHLLIESAWTAARNDPAMTSCFAELQTRMKSNEAIIRIAKKLLNRIMTVWKNETPYVCSVVK